MKIRNNKENKETYCRLIDRVQVYGTESKKIKMITKGKFNGYGF